MALLNRGAGAKTSMPAESRGGIRRAEGCSGRLKRKRHTLLPLPPAIKSQLKDRAKEVSLKNLRPETATIQ